MRGSSVTGEEEPGAGTSGAATPEPDPTSAHQRLVEMKLRPVAVPGFWLPKVLRDRLLSEGTEWASVSFAGGRECGVECAPDEAGAVTATWPVLTPAQWRTLLQELAEARKLVPRGEEFWARLQAALPQAARRLAEAGSETWSLLVGALPAYTGFSASMIAATLNTPEMWDLSSVAASLAYRPTKGQAGHWRPYAGLPGRVRFFPERMLDRLAASTPVAWEMPLFGRPQAPERVVGYGAGNVPGTALLIVLLALATTLPGGPPPAVVVRNSRREPLFSPLVLSALEEVDEELLATVAVLVWDYEDPNLQGQLLGQADLVLAAAGDDTIARIRTALRASAAAERTAPRFHPHGHKVSFSVIGKEVADSLEIVSLLTALDSAYWDQFGCLSSRIHFVEKADPGDWIAFDYGEHLVSWLRRLGQVLPRGRWPLRQLRDTFDRYKALENTQGPAGAVRVLSGYEDPFVVILDEREAPGALPDPHAFITAVNDCQGRVVIIKPVPDLLLVPRGYLSLLPSSSLQSISVALGHEGEGITDRFLEFATACGARGVTALRAAGRGALPQLAYSWDGFLPQDLVCCRPPGRFTTIEFDRPFDALAESYRTHWSRIGSKPGPV